MSYYLWIRFDPKLSGPKTLAIDRKLQASEASIAEGGKGLLQSGFRWNLLILTLLMEPPLNNLV